jgi:hypothetical protein
VPVVGARGQHLGERKLVERLGVAGDLLGGDHGLDQPVRQDQPAQPQTRRQLLLALSYAIVTINGWNRLAVATHMTYEP